LLLKLADECDRGVLCTADWLSAKISRKNEQPPKAGDAKFLNDLLWGFAGCEA
jgi:hypothetical protein